MDIQIIASKFNQRNENGDFNYMIKNDLCANQDSHCLYIYNDNCESYYSQSYKPGGGNAIIRQYNKYNPDIVRPFSAGIPTGSFENGGFDELTPEAINVINGSMKIIEQIINDYSIKTIYYSTNDNSGLLGHSIFDVSDDVLIYITNKIKMLSINKIQIELNEQ